MATEAEQPTVLLPSGAALPLVGFGTWQMTGSQCYRAVRYALEVGYRHLDTATMYRNEADVGRAVRDSGLRREAVFVTTKLPPSDAGSERRTLERSLRALDMDFVDLWLVHWPPSGSDGLPVWKRLLELRDEGLARAVGVSNYSVAQLDELVRATGEAPQVNQIKWGPALYDPVELQEHRRRGVVVEGYSPFKTTDLRHPVLAQVARRHRVTPAQVVIRWHVDHGVVVIPKSATPERIAANFDVFRFSLDDEDLHRIDALAGARRR
ncbi:MAG: 2,5-diketo-D-gluconate reductase [Actinomycetota bacterium]|jgi:diketogulonate reductase-like aldo/keto reductase|nr:2,5-diketo-D-gluconate reductase [Actinomycetota bacterium]MEA2972481.1 2,5-diketo-D-gluconate reductase [Actinomycetota bacterium]